MATHKTEIQTLLAAARRGHFPALLAAADHWADRARDSRAANQSAGAWGHLLANARRMARPAFRERHPRLSPLENTARYFREFAYVVGRSHGNCWRVPRPLHTTHPAWAWCRDMAHALLKYVKALEASRAGDQS